MRDFLRDWGPALVWSACIFVFSTSLFTFQNTSTVLVPLLIWLFPTASPATIVSIHEFIRKSSHFVEFFILSLTLLRGVRAGRPGWRVSWAFSALAIAACYASFDEVHQAFAPGRTASLHDVLLDTSGAGVGQVFAAILARLRM
ncbi:MAG: VanZ family protein [Acidobacteria bacterium]|nr:VanZ family protein [Acidobacteriota bacterium]